MLGAHLCLETPKWQSDSKHMISIATDSFSFSVISPRWFRHHSRHQSGIMALVFTSSQRRGGWERWSLWMSALPPDLFHTCPDTALGLHAASLPLLMRCTKQMVRYACCWPQPFAESEVHGRDYHTKLCTFCVKKKLGEGGLFFWQSIGQQKTDR